MQTGGGQFAGHNPAKTSARTPATTCLAGFFVVAALIQWWGADAPALEDLLQHLGKTGGGPQWAGLCAMRWNEAREAGEWWRVLSYCLVHHSPLHAVTGALGLYAAGRAVEPIIGAGQTLGVAVLGAVVGALASCGANYAATCGAHTLAALSPVEATMGPGTPTFDRNGDGSLLLGTLPMLATLVGVYSTILPDWRMGAASRWRIFFPLTAGAFGCLSAIGCALWWATGWFPEAGPAAMLAGLLAGWCFARLQGFGNPIFMQRNDSGRGAATARNEDMEWEEFLRTKLNPVLDKISTDGIQSLTRAEWRILQQGRKRLEGW